MDWRLLVLILTAAAVAAESDTGARNNSSVNTPYSGKIANFIRKQLPSKKEESQRNGGIQVVSRTVSSSANLDSADTSRPTRETNENIDDSNESMPNITPENQESLPEHKISSEDSDPNRSSRSNTKETSGIIPSIENISTEENSDENISSEKSSKEVPQPNSQIVEDARVETTLGVVKGYQWQYNTDITAFYDIPYGKFEKPFEPPVAAQPWSDIHEAAEHTKVCPQIDNNEYVGEKDCLTLSIFAPKDADKVNVLFHIHDEHASTSADPNVYGPGHLVPKGIILVLPNYRTGPAGFLCLQNETAPGNAGLKDLLLALEWVSKNIESFGGNPENIVVSGDGTAGALAGYLALSPHSKSFIKRAITESGSTLSPWALDREPLKKATKLADKLRELHADDQIHNTFNEFSLETILKTADGMNFMPCIERDREPIVNQTPWSIIHDEDIDSIDITFMMGTASFAGTQEATSVTSELVEQINEHFELLLPQDLAFKNEKESVNIAKKLRSQYFGDAKITLNNIDELSLWYTDASYLSPSIRLARPLAAAGAKVYLYEFAFVGDLNWGLQALNKPVQHAVRGDLAGYLFTKHTPSLEDTTAAPNSAESRMIKLMCDLWISFINTGKPTAENVEWNELKKVGDEEEEWLLISSEPKLKKGVHVERMRLWTDLYRRHFIENSATSFGPRLSLALALLICAMANNKLNYGSQ